MPASWKTAPVKPCGTTAAYKRHLRNPRKYGPPCEDCLAAERRRVAGARRPVAAPKGAGTLAPDRRERRNGLPVFRPYRYRGTGEDVLTWWMDEEAGAA